MKILVTGGAGFMGSSVVGSLLDKGFTVTVLDKVVGKLQELKSPNLEIIVGGIEDLRTVEQAIRDVDVVYHLAESYSSQPHEVFNIDVAGNINLLEKAVERGAKHFIFTSATRVYGKPQYLPVDELHPLTPEDSGRALYALSKFTNERLCLLYHKQYNLPITIFRLWWAYGADIGGKALRTMVDTALKGEAIRVPDKAGGSFLHNDDMTQALQLATLNDKAYGEIFNISSGTCTTWKELAQIVCQLTQSSSRVELVPPQAWIGDVSLGVDGNIPDLWDIDIRKAQGLLNYQPKYSLEGVKETLREAISRLVTSRKE